MNPPKISIIIANFNNGHFFKECFESLLGQTEHDWEAVVIDDKSTDNSVEVIQTLIADDDRFRFYLNEENIGYQKTLIKGIALSASDVFARLDPDDCLEPTAIEECLSVHAAHPEAGLVYTNCAVYDRDWNYMYTNTSTSVEPGNRDFYCLKAEISHFATFKRKYYNLTSGIDPFNKRAEDKDIYIKMYEVAPTCHIDKGLYRYRIHGNSLAQFSNKKRAVFWFWVAIIKAAERKDNNVEDMFLEYFVSKQEFDELNYKLNGSRWIKLGKWLGLMK